MSRVGPSGKMFDEDWREIPDSTPVSVPVNLRPKSMEQMVAMYVQQAMALDSRMKGEENSDEAEDMEVDEEGESEILTPYELHALAADAEREARRKAWLRDQIVGKKRKKEDVRKKEEAPKVEVKQEEQTSSIKAAPDVGESAKLSISQGAPGSR